MKHRKLIFPLLLSVNIDCLALQETFDITKQAYIYAYPLVTAIVTKEIMAQKAPVNQFSHAREFPDDKFTDIVRPNVDTLYSMAWLDLSKSPIILSVPDTHERYYLMEIMDAWTNVFASLGKRTTGTKAKEFAIVGPDFHGYLSKQYKRIDSPTNIAWIIGRTQTNGKKDYEAVRKIQDEYKLTFLKEVKAQQANSIKTSMSPKDYVDSMNAKTFFTFFADALKDNPPSRSDKVILKKLKKIGIEPGKNFDANKLSPEIIAQMDKAIKKGQEDILQESQKFGKKVNGWQIMNDIGTYGINYLTRAIVAMIGIGANLPQDAIYPTTFADSDGKLLNGTNKYVIHFAKGKLPPVNAFWSITMYNSSSYLVPNSINRYALGDRDNLQFNKDGSLDIYITHDAPQEKYLSNWLPAPSQDFNLTLRMYWPKRTALNGSWTPPGVEKIK